MKNINSFKFAAKAIEYEIERHKDVLEKGEYPKQETRGWDEKKSITVSQRSKEEAQDYRYFPDPDIPELEWTTEFIEEIRKTLPELPDEKSKRYQKELGLSEYDANLLTLDRETAEYYESALKEVKEKKDITPKILANWIINKRLDLSSTSPKELVKLIRERSQANSLPDEEIEKIVKEVIAQNPKAVADFRSGKQQALMFLLGQVMRRTKCNSSSKVTDLLKTSMFGNN